MVEKVGLAIFAGGILLLLAYGAYLEIKEIKDIIIVTGTLAVILGISILLVSIVIEQRRNRKKMEREIKKEDLEP
jgi:hypothetical protein